MSEAQAALHPSAMRRAARRVAGVSPASAFALRFAIAISLAIWLGQTPGLVTSHSSWILITVLFVMQPVAGGSILKGLLRICGTLAAALTSIALYGLYAQNPPLLLAGIFVVQALAGYGWAGTRFQYAWFVWAFTTVIILGDALSGTGAVETIAFERAGMVALGLLIVFVVDSLLWPTRAEPSLRASLATRARTLALALQREVEGRSVEERESDAGASPVLGLSAAELSLIGAARTEAGVSRDRVEALGHVAVILEALASRQRLLRQAPGVQGVDGSESTRFQAARELLGRRVHSALERSAEILTTECARGPRADGLGEALLRVEAERERAQGRGDDPRGLLDALTAQLRDLVAMLGTLEEALDGVSGDRPRPDSSSRAQPPVGLWRADPLRVQIGLRVAIAVCGALVANMALGWEFNAIVGPAAFMIAAMPTRGGIHQGILGVAVAVGLGWLVADLLSVYVYTHLGRIPLALVGPFAIAGVLAYVTAVRPQLGILRTVSGIVLFLSVFSGQSAPTDVYGPYSTACYVALAVAVAWAATRLLWPATAARLFRERMAAQLGLCLEAFSARDAAVSRDPDGALLGRYAGQLAQIYQLRTQAQGEPAERGLDDDRRLALLTRVQDLFDTLLALRGEAAGGLAAALEAGGERARPLREALTSESSAIVDSAQAAVAALRGEPSGPGPALQEARAHVESCIAELREGPELGPDIGQAARRAILVKLDLRRQLVTRVLAIERWIADWRLAEQADPA